MSKGISFFVRLRNRFVLLDTATSEYVAYRDAKRAQIYNHSKRAQIYNHSKRALMDSRRNSTSKKDEMSKMLSFESWLKQSNKS